MDALTKQLLRDAGFEIGTEREFLGLSAAQDTIVEIKVRLTALLRHERKLRGWTQAKLAQSLETRQQVVARAEQGHRSVTLDLLLRALLALGVSLNHITRAMEEGEAHLLAQNQGNEVERTAMPGLIRPEQSARHATIADDDALLRLVREGRHQGEHGDWKNAAPRNPKGAIALPKKTGFSYAALTA